MTNFSIRLVLGLLMLALIAGCSTTSHQQVKSHSVSAVLATSTPAPARPKETVHFVRSGDTLSAISRRFGVTSRQLQYHNGIADPHSLKIGARLLIPDGSQQMPAASAHRGPFIWPLIKLDVSSEFGTRNKRHKGIDLRAPQGTTIFASADGAVVFAGRQRGYGKVVILKHADNIKTYYAHNEKNLVSKGQQVRQGEKIATVGRTGNASGNHLHFEFVRGRQRLDPRLHISGSGQSPIATSGLF